jgi:N-acyl-D-aspartate/D-glutamate deacylase
MRDSVLSVFVGGVAVLENGEMTGQRPGRWVGIREPGLRTHMMDVDA